MPDPIWVNFETRQGRNEISFSAKKMRFCADRVFAFDHSAEDLRCLSALANALSKKNNLALYGAGPLLEYLLRYQPALKSHVRLIVVDTGTRSVPNSILGIPDCHLEELPVDVATVFITATRTLDRMRMRANVRQGIEVLDLEILTRSAWDEIPSKAWIPEIDCIYPIDIPEIKFESGMDIILVDCPARNLALMPNGLAYVHNALKKTGIRFQTVDLDIIVYHRFHTHRLLDAPGKILTPGGYEMAPDPWLAEAYDEWQNPEVIRYFQPEIDEAVDGIIKANPKILGLSIQACSIPFARKVVEGVRRARPDTLILAGGYSCYQPSIGRRAFPECDYMVIGEADLVVGELVQSLALGERPHNMPGVMSRFDSPDWKFQEAPMPMELDPIEFPKYEWTNLSVYRNHNHYQLTPIIASRGCRWSKCTFCAERFFWRVRTPQNVVNEFEWLHDHGCNLFMFNESDLNGKPEILLEICDEIIRRNLKIKLTGQLRIHKKSDRAFFDRLREAGFVALRFGVDAWSLHGLMIQKKGYTPPMIIQNLKDCSEAGIYIEVNTVIGVPGETEDDIDESIELIEKCKPYIGRIANINPLMLIIGSVYWEDPGKFNIVFRESKDNIYSKYPNIIPDDLWYSTEPYIDRSVREKRFQRMVEALHKMGFDMGSFAAQVIKDVGEGKGADRSARPGALAKPVSCETQSIKGTHVVSDDHLLGTQTLHADLTGYKMIRFRDEFYGVKEADFPSIKDVLHTEAHVHYPSLFRHWLQHWVSKITRRGRTSPWQNVRHHLRRGEWQLLFHKAAGKWKESLSEAYSLSRTTVRVTEKIENEIRLLLEGFHGYNILEAKRRYYGLKQGYEFDPARAQTGDYPEGVCFTGINQGQIECGILRHLLDQGIVRRIYDHDFSDYDVFELGRNFYALPRLSEGSEPKAGSGFKYTYLKTQSMNELKSLIFHYRERSPENPSELSLKAGA